MPRYRFHRIRSYRTMTPACLDFCSTSRPVWYSSDRSLSRSPRISTLTFPAQLHHLQWPLNHLASSSCANSPPAYASYDVFVHQLAVLRPASSGPLLTDQPLPFASSYRLITTGFSTVILLQRTFTSLVNAHVGRTHNNQRERGINLCVTVTLCTASRYFYVRCGLA